MKFGTIIILLVLLISSYSAFAQLQRPSLTVVHRPGNFILRTKRTKEQKKRLEPNEQDLITYERFLSTPKTGIFRLMPDLGCTENVNIIRADPVCLNFIPESSFYSFREKEHTIGMLADIRLRNGFLVSDGVLAQSILVHLGEVELESVAPHSEGVKFISDYAPNTQSAEAQKQYVQMMRGIKAGNYEYKKAWPAIENATYALRVIAYKGSIFRSFRGYRFDVLFGDKRVDLTIAFRIIRKEKDGGVTLLWREIDRREAPRLVFPKRAKKT